MKINDKKDLGYGGEHIAENYLRNNNYEIIEKNFLCRQGEIDIIAKKDEYIVFIEVKTRSNIKFGMPAEAVNWVKKNHLYKAAKYYLYKRNLYNEYIRFDVIEIMLSNGKFLVNHIKQIF